MFQFKPITTKLNDPNDLIDEFGIHFFFISTDFLELVNTAGIVFAVVLRPIGNFSSSIRVALVN